MEILDFKSKEDFRNWLKKNHDSVGRKIFIYKKKHLDKGMGYEDAVRTALCFGWIDATTNSYDDIKFIQYFAKRKEKSNWSISNIKRMKALIESGQMTELGLKTFDLKLIEQLPELEAEEEKIKSGKQTIPDFFLDLLKEHNALELFNKETNSQRRMFIHYILDAKQEKTKIRRCLKVIGILNGEKNNL
ncbi:hypothetical protein EZV73_04280 [Acidaminobacter sp. JC074]|uniref:YdeI/OmpD-associated family protein n=1 Tax=Acidaminobacter sp. JC074 TaxID=2530199 RepID=UPI001F0ECE2E|nr:YdeI/OmpD-associated family protein [Acidaminobacter sp. JC074]MCH4886770.1 hypothetical protein [Acidaminobacter sp. JC074]